LSDVLAGLCPVEVPRITRQNDDAAGWIGLDLVAVELIAQADVEDTRHDGVDAILGVLMRHEFHARGHLDPDHVRSGLSGFPNKTGRSGRRRECRERLPVDVFWQNRSENGFAWLVVTNHCASPSISHRLPWMVRLSFGERLNRPAGAAKHAPEGFQIGD